MFILTVRNDRLGDLILALPTLAALRRRYPDARLGVVASDYAAPALELYSDSVEVWRDSDSNLERLASDRPDAILFLYPDVRWAKAARRARVETRVGTRNRLHSWRFNRRVNVHRKYNAVHEAAYNLLVAEPLIGDTFLSAPELRVDSQVEAKAVGLLAKHGMTQDEDYIVLHPGTGGSALDWPVTHFAELATILQRQGRRVIITGADQERDICGTVAGHGAVSLAGATDIPVLAGVLAGAQRFVAGSTGPLHLAAAVGTATVALFSPHLGHSPRRWGPLGDTHVVLQPSVPPCRCPAGRCQLDGCMTRLSPEFVADVVMQNAVVSEGAS